MKNVVLPRLLVLFYLFLSLSKALATPTAIYVSVEQEVLSNKSIDRRPAPGCSGPASSLGLTHSVVEPSFSPGVQEFTQWLQNNESIIRKICFYSGESGGAPVYPNMPAFSQIYGCDYRDGLLEKAGIKDIVWERWLEVDWIEASRVLAEVARDKAIAILGETVNESSVWMKVEQPTLKKSGKVHELNKYTMELRLKGPVVEIFNL
ncbi:hypothetical protein EST38_g12438 [Candolleomyces aberdarensis]|uniref:Uncharacterized protein n=1 Tax=Candolleomyces aberdarensis TaxID=2316362 RepID=A0A4V1Q206_9AGAR|nr:hypothetical protein EST38_g12438 [Candolleomyces aberdarensis]